MTTDELINVIQHGSPIRAAGAKLKLRSEIAVMTYENERLKAEIYNAKGRADGTIRGRVMSIDKNTLAPDDVADMYATARWNEGGQPVNASAAMADAYEWLKRREKVLYKPVVLRRCMRQLARFGAEIDK